MKKSELQQIIKEEIQHILKEYSSYNSFKVSSVTKGYENPINPSLLSKILPMSAKTRIDAEERLRTFEGGQMYVYNQVHYVKPNSNRPDRPLFYFGQSQYYLRNDNVNVTKISIMDVTEAGLNWTNNKSKVKNLGWAFVDTDVFLKEMKISYEIIKKVS